MSSMQRKRTVKTSRGRLIFWGVCAAVIVYLSYGLLRDRGSSAARYAAKPAEKGAAVAPGERTPTGPPAARIGVLARASHLVVLSGLEMNAYAVALVTAGPDAWLESRVFERPSGLVDALKSGELDLACVPTRDVVTMRAALGDRAPLVVAGVARGDERLVVHESVGPTDRIEFGRLEIGVLEPPALDLRAALGLDGDDSPTVFLIDAEAILRKLTSTEIDAAVLPEPLASQVAALSGSRVEPSAVAGARLPPSGAVLVATRAFVESKPELLVQLLGMHEFAALTSANDAETAIRRALATLKKAGTTTAPEVVWREASRGIAVDTDVPRDDLERILEIAHEQGRIDDAVGVDSLIRTEPQAAARAAMDEAQEELSDEAGSPPRSSEPSPAEDG